MSADIVYLPPRCPACHRPMQLIEHEEAQPRIRAFVCKRCEKDLIR